MGKLCEALRKTDPELESVERFTQGDRGQADTIRDFCRKLDILRRQGGGKYAESNKGSRFFLIVVFALAIGTLAYKRMSKNIC